MGASALTAQPLDTLILALEWELLDPEVRRSPQRLDGLLADEFAEVGVSGQLFLKRDVLDQLPVEIPVQFHLDSFALRRLAPDAVLATYRLAERDGASSEVRLALRSSIWQFRDGRWQMAFHQGTVVSRT